MIGGWRFRLFLGTTLLLTQVADVTSVEAFCLELDLAGVRQNFS